MSLSSTARSSFAPPTSQNRTSAMNILHAVHPIFHFRCTEQRRRDSYFLIRSARRWPIYANLLINSEGRIALTYRYMNYNCSVSWISWRWQRNLGSPLGVLAVCVCRDLWPCLDSVFRIPIKLNTFLLLLILCLFSKFEAVLFFMVWVQTMVKFKSIDRFSKTFVSRIAWFWYSTIYCTFNF